MHYLRIRLPTVVALLCLALMSASPIAAAPGGNGNGNGNAGGNGNGNGGNGNGGNISPPSLAATPELDSLALFATGAAGIAGYGLMRIRAGRRQDKPTD